jgi:esterase/lipase
LERVRWKNTNPTTVEWVKQNYLEIFGKYNKQVQKYRAGMLVCGLLVGGLISRKLYQRYFKESERLYSITAISAKNILSVITRILEENKDYDSDARSSVENAKQDLQQIIQLNNSVQATSYTIFSTLATKLYRN